MGNLSWWESWDQKPGLLFQDFPHHSWAIGAEAQNPLVWFHWQDPAGPQAGWEKDQADSESHGDSSVRQGSPSQNELAACCVPASH